MATHSVPAEHRLFIARADWRDESQYPPPNLLDPSIWSWELLRRNYEYAQEFARLQPLYADVPATPFPMDSLLHYVSDPPPEREDVDYKTYRERHSRHIIYPIRDHVRKSWGINVLVDPNSDFTTVIDRSRIYDKNNKIAWLFACNTADAINSPTTVLVNKHGLTRTSAFTTAHEVLFRITLTGNLDEQIESLRRQIATFFDGGNRNGDFTFTEYIDVSDSPTARYSQEHHRPIDDQDELSSYTPGIAASSSMWNWKPVRLKSLHYVVRMADVFASLEQGAFLPQLEQAGIRSNDVRLIAELCRDFERLPYDGLYEPMSRVLAQFFDLHPLGKDARDADAKTILRWLEMAVALVAERDYLHVARTNAHTS
ncbi:transcriptional regulator domain-containing protein [Burkholderia sp. MR1-5-21]